MRVVWINLVAFALICTGIAEEMKHMSVRISFNAAHSYCSSLGSSYSLVDDTVSSERLNEYMKKNDLTSVWLGIERRPLSGWTRVDGREVRISIPGEEHRGRACGGVSTVAGSLKAMPCNYGGDHEGVVCEHEYYSSDTWNPDLQVFQYRENFTFQCGVKNWYEARDMCKTKNASIAILDDQDKIDSFVNTKMGVPSLGLCGFFWIGLRMEEWYSTNADHSRIVNKSNWDNEEPKISGKCAVANLLKWTVDDCEQKHTALCTSFPVSSTKEGDFKIATKQTPVLSKPKGNGTIDDPREKGKWVLPVILGSVIGITIICLTTMCLLRRAKNKSQRKLSLNNREKQELIKYETKGTENEDLADKGEQTVEVHVKSQTASNINDDISDSEETKAVARPSAVHVSEITREMPISSSNPKLDTKETQDNQKKGISQNRQSRRNENIQFKPLRSLISNFDGGIKISMIFKKHGVFHKRMVKVKPFDQDQESQHVEKQCDVQTHPLLNTKCEASVPVGVQTLSVISRLEGEKCDILVIEANADEAQNLIRTHSHYLKDMCVLLSAAQIDRARIAGTIIVKEFKTSDSIADNIDINVNSRICNENVLVRIGEKPEEHNAATWYIANLVALILMFGKQNGLKKERYQRLRQTQYMLKVMKQMKFSNGTDTEKTEPIYPWGLLRRIKNTEEAINKAVSID